MTKANENDYFNTGRMADIILTLKELWKNSDEEYGRLIDKMIDHLIRDESDYIVPKKKSRNVEEKEKEFGSLKGLHRNQIKSRNQKLSSEIRLEHGLTIYEAIEKCKENCNSKTEIEAVLEESKNSLNYITKEEDARLGKKFSKDRPDGFEAAYIECDIHLVNNI